MNKTVKTIAIIIGILIVVSMIGKSPNKVITPAETPTRIPMPTVAPTAVPTVEDNASMFGTNGYTKTMELEYMDSCLNKEESNNQFCLCSLMMLEQNYSASEVQRLVMEGKMVEGKIPQKIIDIASYCVEKFPY